MQVFKNKWFARFARKNRIEDSALKLAVSDIEAGNFDADLGGCVYKRRVARSGQGKSAGYRTVVLLRRGERAFFVYGFAKKDLDNIADDILSFYKNIAKSYIAMTDAEISAAKNIGELMEI